MASKRPRPNVAGYLFYDVLYEDGTRSSHRKVPAEEISPFDKEGSIKAIIEAQDRKVAEMSGRLVGRIKSVIPSGR